MFLPSKHLAFLQAPSSAVPVVLCFPILMVQAGTPEVASRDMVKEVFLEFAAFGVGSSPAANKVSLHLMRLCRRGLVSVPVCRSKAR